VPVTVLGIKAIPATRRERIEAAVEAASGTAFGIAHRTGPPKVTLRKDRASQGFQKAVPSASSLNGILLFKSSMAELLNGIKNFPYHAYNHRHPSELFEEEERLLVMQTGNYGFAPGLKMSEDVENALREAVEIALEEFKAAPPEQKPGAAKRLSDALRSFDALLAVRCLVPKVRTESSINVDLRSASVKRSLMVSPFRRIAEDAVMCTVNTCGRSASYIFSGVASRGGGPFVVAAYCDRHAEQAAVRFGYPWPVLEESPQSELTYRRSGSAG
jgi:hypothetical protein